MGVHHSSQPVENLCVTRTCDSIGGRSHQRVMPGTGVSVVDNRRARGGII
jgi:hypothetical protein